MKSESPSHDSHRHVGEGVLDDSDSSDSDKAKKERKAEDGSSDEDSGLKPLMSPYQSTRVVPTTPSPLSHVASQQQWSEDEEDGKEDNEASPSPGSTDTESSSGSGGSTQQKKKTKSNRSRRNSRAKSRSRSSTVASLAASSHLQIRKPLVRQESKGSARTVIAGDVSVGEPDSREETVMDMSANGKAFSPESWKRQRSQAVSSDFGSNAPDDVEAKVLEVPEQIEKMGEKSRLRIIGEETKFREMGWDTLRDAFRRFSDEGDVQMCSMLSVVAPQELKVEKRRVARFLDSYIGSFSALRCLKFPID
jgi:hypothetical protein